MDVRVTEQLRRLREGLRLLNELLASMEASSHISRGDVEALRSEIRRLEALVSGLERDIM